MSQLTELVYENAVRLSAFLLVVHCSDSYLNDGIEFHVDCLAIGMGDLIDVNLYDWANKDNLTEITRLKHLYKPGNVLRAQEVGFHVSGDISVWCAKLEFVENKELAEAFSFHVRAEARLDQEQKADREKIDDDADYLRGFVVERQVIITKQIDLMVFVTIETEKGSIEAIFFPEVYRRFQNMLLIKEEMQLRGRYQSGNGMPKRFVVDFMAPYGNMDYKN